MSDYWAKKNKTEKEVYIGHINAYEWSYIVPDLPKCIKNFNVESIRVSILRDLSDSYPYANGSSYGRDVWVLCKPGCYKKNLEIIEKLKTDLEKECEG